MLFHDNYWENLGDGFISPIGEAVAGAYVRYLSDLSGGYNNTLAAAPDHSNVHLWYFGTIDLATPANNSEAVIGDSERTRWWVADEGRGGRGGFFYSLIGGGDRLSPSQPLGPGSSAIRDGYNQRWNLGAGTSSNRTALSSNNGAWPNAIRLNRLDTNVVVQGQNTSVKLYYQWAQPNSSAGTISFFLDDDLNPLNAPLPGVSRGRIGSDFSVLVQAHLDSAA